MSATTPANSDTVTGRGNAATGSDAPANSDTVTGHGLRNNNGTRGKRGSHYVHQSDDKDFLGSEPKVGAVLGLRMERITKKVTMEIFKDKLINYIGREMTRGDDIACIVKDGSDPKPNFDANYKPKDLTDEEEKKDLKVKIYLKDYDRYTKLEDEHKDNLKKLYSIIWGQCSDQLQSAIKYVKDFDLKNNAKDIVWLLRELQRETAGIDSLGNKHVNYIKALKALLNIKQHNDENDEVYYKRMKANIDSLKLAGGKHVLCSPDLVEKTGTTATAQEEDYEADQFFGILLLTNSDAQRYGILNKELLHAAQFGNNDYPNTSSGAYELMCRRSGRYDHYSRSGGGRGSGSNNGGRGGRGNGGRYNRAFEFLQQQNLPEGCSVVPGTDGTTIDLQCYRCQDFGHLANNCPADSPRACTDTGRRGVGLMQCSFNQGDDALIPRSWLLLDTCSTCSVINNKDLVKNLRVCNEDEILDVHTNGGIKKFKEVGTLKLFPITVHYSDSSLANILSLNDIAALKGVHITMDTRIQRDICVHFEDQIMTFRPCKNGLYFFDMNKLKNKDTISTYSFLATVKQNSEFFSPQEIQGAKDARALQQKTGWPSTANLKVYISKQLLNNCKVTVDGVNRADIIFGPAEPILEGKMVRKIPTGCKIKRVPLPLPMKEHYTELELYIYILC